MHSQHSKAALVAREEFSEPRLVQSLKPLPNRKELGKTFKQLGKVGAHGPIAGSHWCGSPKGPSVAASLQAQPSTVWRGRETCIRCDHGISLRTQPGAFCPAGGRDVYWSYYGAMARGNAEGCGPVERRQPQLLLNCKHALGRSCQAMMMCTARCVALMVIVAAPPRHYWLSGAVRFTGPHEVLTYP